MVGLGGLEPPTSPLSGARSSHLSYRPIKTACRNAYNLFSLRCLSVIRNWVQIRTLCTRQQFLCHLSLLIVLKVRVVARDSQTGMADLIFHEVAGHHVRLHVAHSTVSEGVHPTGFDVPPMMIVRRLMAETTRLLRKDMEKTQSVWTDSSYDSSGSSMSNIKICTRPYWNGRIPARQPREQKKSKPAL
jgi:hypothetical protein